MKSSILYACLFLAAISCARPAETQQATVSVQTPSAGWSLKPLAVYQTTDEYWLVFQLQAPDGPAAQVISEVSSTIHFQGNELPQKRFVLGKTWNWNSNPEIVFLDSLEPLQADLQAATQIAFETLPPS